MIGKSSTVIGMLFSKPRKRLREQKPMKFQILTKNMVGCKFDTKKYSSNLISYRMILSDETQLEETQLQEAMLDRKRWRRLVNR